MCSVELLAEDIVTINNMIKWHITANISVGLHENCLLVRSCSGKCNTRWFMMFFCVRIVIALAVVLLWWKIGERRSQKIDDLPVLATCRSGTLVMLSSKVNSPVTHETTQ